MSRLDMFAYLTSEVWVYLRDDDWKIVRSGQLWYAHRNGRYCDVLNSRDGAEEYVRTTHALLEAAHVS